MIHFSNTPLPSPPMKLITVNLIVFGFTHALVDATCAAIIASQIKIVMAEPTYLAALIVLYNMLAFGTLAPFGIIVDKYKIPMATAIAGCVLTGLACFLYHTPFYALLIAGIGNALFHLGGGVFSLNMNDGKATVPGIFVAPGALGLTVGGLVGKLGYFNPWHFFILLLLSSLLIYFIKKPEVSYKTESKIEFNHFDLIIILLLLTITVRSLAGLAVEFPWKVNINLLIILTMAVVFGKALGGILGDKFGWSKITISGLLLAAPLIAFGKDYPALAITGIFLLNMTMPVTMVAIANMMPGQAGLAFGLSTLAIITGALPTFTEYKKYIAMDWVLLIIIILSALCLYQALRLYFRDIKQGEGGSTGG